MTITDTASKSTTLTYLTGCVKPAALAQAHRPDFGVLVTPDTKSYRKHIEAFGTWGADNACFSQANPWIETEDMSGRKERAWLKFLVQMVPWIATCLWATIPDVVGDHAATLARWAKYVGYAKAHGYRPAFVAQNGCTPEAIPADAEALFVGGVTECLPCGYTRPAAEFRIRRCPSCDAKLTEWKESEAARLVVAEAQRRGMQVHMGRTNGADRMRLCAQWGINTADGTYILRGEGAQMTARVMEWLDEANGPIVVEADPGQGTLF